VGNGRPLAWTTSDMTVSFRIDIDQLARSLVISINLVVSLVGKVSQSLDRYICGKTYRDAIGTSVEVKVKLNGGFYLASSEPQDGDCAGSTCQQQRRSNRLRQCYWVRCSFGQKWPMGRGALTLRLPRGCRNPGHCHELNIHRLLNIGIV